jgi:hypothetical protein
MLVLPMLFETFQSPNPENRIFRQYALDGHGLGPRQRPWRVRQVRASVVEKLRAASGKTSTSGSFDSAPSSAVSQINL